MGAGALGGLSVVESGEGSDAPAALWGAGARRRWGLQQC